MCSATSAPDAERAARRALTQRMTTSTTPLGPDLFRKESFGALYYRRSDARFFALPPEEAALLAASTTLSAMEVREREPERFALDDNALIKAALFWKREGLVDDDFRLHATIIDDDRSHGALLGPMVTNIQLTRACNLSCGHCFVDIWKQRDPDELSLEQIDALFADLARMGAPIVILAGGEPMLRPDFFEIVEAGGAHGLDLALCTNATLIDENKARRLVEGPMRWFSVSLDGPDAETHDALRGPGRFDHALRGVRHLVEAGADTVKLRATVTGENAHTLPGFAQVAMDTGAHRVVVKPYRHTATHRGTETNALYLSRGAYRRATDACAAGWPADAPPLEVDDGMPEGPPDWTKVIPRFGCVGGTTHASVLYDGRVVACDAVQDEGDWTLHTHSFRDAWRRAPTIASWRDLEGNESCRTSCDNGPVCKGGCRARALGMGGSLDDPDPWSYCADEDAPGPRGPRSARADGLLPILG